MIIDAHAHMMNGRYFDRLISKGGKWARENVDRVLAVTQRKP